MHNYVQLIILALENSLKAEWSEFGSVSIVELVLELHPVQTQGMQESREPLHHQQNSHRHACEVCMCEGEGVVSKLSTGTLWVTAVIVHKIMTQAKYAKTYM